MPVRLTREEVALVLDTYLQIREESKDALRPVFVRSNRRITELSYLLRSLTIHPVAVRSDPSFRPADGVAARVRRFAVLGRGKGIRETLYSEIWDEFSEDREALGARVEQIKHTYSGHELEPGRKYSWAELGKLFDFKPGYLARAGGLVSRPKQGCLLVISNQFDSQDFDYGDVWDGAELIYTGRGLSGDQELTRENAILARNAHQNSSRKLLVFQGAGSKTLEFTGEMYCCDYEQDSEEDIDGLFRTVFKFRLRFVDAALEAQRSEASAAFFEVEKARKTRLSEAIDSAKHFGSGESDAHRILKEWVAAHPESIGLDENSDAAIEYQFLSPDRADVVFETPPRRGGRYSLVAVEIELEGERNCRVGAWQAIKYRTLLAVQYGLPLDWEEKTERTALRRPQIEVSAVLVAHKIDKKVRELCAKYKVKWFEFPPEKLARIGVGDYICLPDGKLKRSEDMFVVGDRVRHERFGVGIILKAESVEIEGLPSQKLRIDFADDVGKKVFYYPPASLRDIATEAPAEDVAAQEVVPEAPAEDVEQIQRMKLRVDWGGPTLAEINAHLNAQDKQQIQQIFYAAVPNFGVETDVLTIHNLMGRFPTPGDPVGEGKLAWCAGSQIPWVRRLGIEMDVLYRLFKAHQSDEAALPEEAYNCIGATLYWFVNLYDYVPDAIPGYGHLDDAIVLNHCITKLNRMDRNRFIQ